MTSVADSFLAAARLTAMRNSPPPDPIRRATGLRYYPASQGNAEGLITPPPLLAAGFGNDDRQESSSIRVSFDDEEERRDAAGMVFSPAKKVAGAVSSSASNHPSSRYGAVDVDEDDTHGLVPVLGGGYGY